MRPKQQMELDYHKDEIYFDASHLRNFNKKYSHPRKISNNEILEIYIWAIMQQHENKVTSGFVLAAA